MPAPDTQPPEKTGPGAPKGNQNASKGLDGTVLRFFCSAEEKNAWMRAKGQGPLAEWVRATLNKEAGFNS